MANLFQNKVISGETLTFNNLAASKEEWEGNWKVSVKDSWLARYLPKGAVAHKS